jgi:AcrR family transcriptional regulator
MPTESDGEPHGGGRQARRREQTRRRLLDAARTLFAQQGLESTRINEITEQADVGFGSFYTYFESKEAIVRVVLEEVAVTAGATIERLTADLEDPAEVVAVAHCSFVLAAASDPELAWLFVRMEATHEIAQAVLRPYAERNLQSGIDAGRLSVDDVDVALLSSGGALLGVMRGVLLGQVRVPDAARYHAAGILRMYGLAPDDAAACAIRAMSVASRAEGLTDA